MNFFCLGLVIGGPEDAPTGGGELILPGGRKPGATEGVFCETFMAYRLKGNYT